MFLFYLIYLRDFILYSYLICFILSTPSMMSLLVVVASSSQVLDVPVPDQLLLLDEVRQSSLLGFLEFSVENWVYYVNKR